jgi:hypothetical protein
MPDSPNLERQRALAREQDRAARRRMGAPLALTDAGLDQASAVTEADALAAESLWDQAQRRARTGLGGLLSAGTDDDA